MPGADDRSGGTSRPARRRCVCCGRVNRGFGILGDTLFMATLDAHLIALDRRPAQSCGIRSSRITKRPTHQRQRRSSSRASDYRDGRRRVRVRGFIDAYDATTGKRTWRFHTIPAPGEKGSETWPRGTDGWQTGGGATWMSGSYDPELNLLYWGTGNAGPQMFGDDREGDNLYAASMVALDADTARCDGTTSSRRTMFGTTTRPTCLCLPMLSSTDSLARS